MSNIADKNKIRELLALRNFGGIIAWAESKRSPQRVMFSLALDADELTAWRAIEAMGKIAAMESRKDLERIRDMVRRLLWLMNDESGGLGWRSPELIGEILVNVPVLIDDFGGLLPAYFKEEPFERGTYLAVARIASINPKIYGENVDQLKESLSNPDPAIKCHAVAALYAIDEKLGQSIAKKLENDTSPVTLYDFNSGNLIATTVRQYVSQISDPDQTSEQAA